MHFVTKWETCFLLIIFLLYELKARIDREKPMEKEKEEFLKEFGEDYGYPNAPKSIDQIRSVEFRRLDQQGMVCLDHAGATLYSESQMESIFKHLTSSVYGNPHSQSESSSATSEVIREARQMVLEFCNASPKDYKCIFTSGATAGLKLVGEAFPWTPSSCFMYSLENHNSVLGIREYALSLGASAQALDIEDTIENGNFTTKVSQRPLQRRSQLCDDEITGDAYNLFAIPSECNFSGVRFNLDLVNTIKEGSERVLEGSPFCRNKWMFLIDAAKGCATEKLDLSNHPADFVVLSFYKLFGYPTGLGALLVSTDAAKLLCKNYFSGGTVAASISDVDFVKRREAVEELFEDGTSSFLSIAAIRYGFKVLNALTITAISRHTTSLATYLRRTLQELRHENGAHVCILYGDHIKDMGPIVSFNLKRPDGSWFGYREVEKLASLSGIQLRTGCFCNPGACAKYLGLSHQDLLSNIEAGHVCWDDHDVLHGKPTGAVRVSFGYMSTYEDMKKFIDFVKEHFVKLQNLSLSCLKLEPQPILCRSQEASGVEREPSVGIRVKSIHVYPIKSCGGFSVKHWPLSSAGLLHDREWLLESLTGETLSLKKVPEMCFVTTYIDLDQGKLIVQSPHFEENLEIKIKSELHDCSEEETGLCTPRHGIQHYDDDVNKWFSKAIGRPCILVRCSTSANRRFLKRHGGVGRCRDADIRSNFANEAEFLLISEESISDLNNRVNSNMERGPRGGSVRVTANRFRPNIVISGGEPYVEDNWQNLRIGQKLFTSVGGCNRCQVINFAVEGGRIRKSNEPLATLASYRRLKGRILFGVLLKYGPYNEIEEKDSWIKVGDEVFPNVT